VTPITDAFHVLLRALSGPVVERLGWALVHSLWQGAAVAVLLALVLLVLRRATPQMRHAASLAALLVLATLPAVTFVALSGRAIVPAPASAAGALYPDPPVLVPQSAAPDMPVPQQSGPMLMVEACVELVALAEALVGRSNVNASSDLNVAAMLGEAAARGAAENVIVNLPAIGDEAYAGEATVRVKTLLDDVETTAAATREAVLSGGVREPLAG